MSFSVDKLQRPKSFDSDVPLIQVVFKVSSDAKYQKIRILQIGFVRRLQIGLLLADCSSIVTQGENNQKQRFAGVGTYDAAADAEFRTCGELH